MSDTDRVTQIVATTPASAAVDRRLRLRVASCWMAGCGLVLVIIGSFLPWVVSGTVRRSSYAIVGVIDRLGIAGEGVLPVLLGSWPFIGVLCFAPVVATALRWWRVGGILAILIGLFASILSLGILAFGLGTSGTVRLDPLGPAVMAAGGLLLIGGGLCLMIGNSSPIRHRNGRSAPVDPS